MFEQKEENSNNSSLKTNSVSKIVTKYKATTANVHDSQVLDDLIDETDKGGGL